MQECGRSPSTHQYVYIYIYYIYKLYIYINYKWIFTKRLISSHSGEKAALEGLRHFCPMLAKYSFVGAEKLSAMSCHYPPELLSNWYNVSHREASARFCQMDVLSLPTRIVLQLTAHRLCYLRRGFPHGNLGTDWVPWVPAGKSRSFPSIPRFWAIDPPSKWQTSKIPN